LININVIENYKYYEFYKISKTKHLVKIYANIKALNGYFPQFY